MVMEDKKKKKKKLEKVDEHFFLICLKTQEK